MKKLLSLFLVLSILFSIAVSAVSFASDSVIYSASFEEGFDKCTFYAKEDNQIASMDNETALKENAAHLKDTSATGSVYLRTPEIEVKEDVSYLTVVNMQLVSGTVKVYVKFLDKDGNSLDNKSAGLKTGAYKDVRIERTAPAGAVSMQVLVSANATTEGEAYVKSITVSLGNGAVPQAEIKKAKASYDKNVRSFSVKDSTEDYTAKGINSEISFKENSMCINTSDAASLDITPKEPIYVDNLNMKFRYKLKAVAEKISASFTFYFYGTDENKQTSIMAISYPVTDRWYEGEIDLMDAGAVSGKEVFLHGDYIKNYRIVARSYTGKNVEAYFEYAEFISGQPDMWGAPVGQEIMAGVAGKLKEAAPGDTIIIPNGTYTSVKMDFSAEGREGKPVTVVAETPGQVIINGLSTLRINGSYLTVDGLFFEKGWSPELISFNKDSHHCRLTNTAVVDCNSSDRSSKATWVSVGGKHNQVDHCFFNKKNSHGVLFSFGRNEEPDYTVISHNYFGHFEPSVVGNGAETIRTGSGMQAYEDSGAIIENNFFEECDGEGELISVKAAKLTVRNNTIYNSSGGICLRAGDGNTVDSNLIYNARGIIVHGENQTIKNNYITQASDEPIQVNSGTDTLTPVQDTYTPIKNVFIANNTIAGCKDTVAINNKETPSDDTTASYKRKYPPEGLYEKNLSLVYNDNTAVTVVNNNAPDMTYKSNVQIGGKKNGINGFSYNSERIKKTDKGLSYSDAEAGVSKEVLEKMCLDPREFLCPWILEKVNLGTGGFNIGKIPYIYTEENGIDIFINNKKLECDVAPYTQNGRTLIPMRAIFEELNADVLWDEATATATAIKEETTVKLVENSVTAYVNENPVTLDVPATIVNGRFVVPVRFISETLGADVGWNEYSNTVIINASEAPYPASHKIDGELDIYNIIQSGDDGPGTEITNLTDNKFGTNWAVLYDENTPDSAWGIFDFGNSKQLKEIHIIFTSGHERVYTFDVYSSDDNVNYTPVLQNAKSSGSSTEFEVFPLNVKARYIKIVGKGNSVNNWVNLREVAFTK